MRPSRLPSFVLREAGRHAIALLALLAAACANGSGDAAAGAAPEVAPALPEGAPATVVGRAVILSPDGRSGWHAIEGDSPANAACLVRREPTVRETRASVAAVWWTRTGPPGAGPTDLASFHWIELRDEAGTSVALFACALAEAASAADLAAVILPAARLAD